MHLTYRKKNLFNTLLALPDFTKVFKIECDVLGIGIEAVLIQDKLSISYFNKNLNVVALNYLTYDKELCTLVRTLEI
jgi:hypothetical protein